MNHTITMFLKFGEEERIRDLYENGTIYMNTLEYFRKLEDQELRGDNREGDVKVVNSLPGTIKIPDIEREFNYQKVHYRIKPEPLLGNIYSLYCISSHGFPNTVNIEIDKNNFRFGSHCLMIKDCRYFLDRMEKALNTLDQPFKHGFVKYYDKDEVSKDLTTFDKPLEFEYQKEFRFFVDNDVIEPIKFQIGSLEGYAEIFNSVEVESLQLIKN